MQSDREEDRERLTVPATANQTIKRAGKRNYGLSLRLEDAGGRARVTPSAAARPLRHPEGPALPIFALLSSF